MDSLLRQIDEKSKSVSSTNSTIDTTKVCMQCIIEYLLLVLVYIHVALSIGTFTLLMEMNLGEHVADLNQSSIFT